MDRYIGIDAHLESCTVCVVGPSGRRLKEQVVETNGQALRDFLLSIAGQRHICLEEGELSEWLYELVVPLGKSITVVQPGKRKGQKSDSIDAAALAELIRTKSKQAKVIYKAPGAFGGLKEAVRAHRTISRDVVRSKNRLRAVFRARGIHGFGQDLYKAEARLQWLDKLSVARRRRAELLSTKLDVELDLLDQAEADLREHVRACAIVRLLESAPGIGFVRASQVVATVITPHRFRTKRQFWAYCGLAVVSRTTSEWKPDKRGGFRRKRNKKSNRGLNRNCNPLLKEVFKGAALTVVQSHSDSALGQNYRRLVEQEQLDPAMARLTLARQIAAIVLAMWKKQEAYDPTRYPSPKTAS